MQSSRWFKLQTCLFAGYRISKQGFKIACMSPSRSGRHQASGFQKFNQYSFLFIYPSTNKAKRSLWLLAGSWPHKSTVMPRENAIFCMHILPVINTSKFLLNKTKPKTKLLTNRSMLGIRTGRNCFSRIASFAVTSPEVVRSRQWASYSIIWHCCGRVIR